MNHTTVFFRNGSLSRSLKHNAEWQIELPDEAMKLFFRTCPVFESVS